MAQFHEAITRLANALFEQAVAPYQHTPRGIAACSLSAMLPYGMLTASTSVASSTMSRMVSSDSERAMASVIW